MFQKFLNIWIGLQLFGFFRCKKSNLFTLFWWCKIIILHFGFIKSINYIFWFVQTSACEEIIWLIWNISCFESHFFEYFSFQTFAQIFTIVYSTSGKFPEIILFFYEKESSFIIVNKRFHRHSVKTRGDIPLFHK